MSFQNRELAVAQATSSDLDYAFELQLQEALEASMGTTQDLHHEAANNASNAEGKAIPVVLRREMETMGT